MESETLFVTPSLRYHNGSLHVMRANCDRRDVRYRYLKELGKGGQGRVTLVLDNVRRQRVALKRARRVDGASLLALKREFRGVRELIHPNIVRLYELDQDSDGVFFTMEAVEGSDLRA